MRRVRIFWCLNLSAADKVVAPCMILTHLASCQSLMYSFDNLCDVKRQAWDTLTDTETLPSGGKPAQKGSLISGWKNHKKMMKKTLYDDKTTVQAQLKGKLREETAYSAG